MENRFNQLLEKSAAEHGHLCPGQVLGVRMAMLGLALLGYQAPLDDVSIKKVVVFVEIDRCAADAIASATGVKLGRRSLKFKDFGIMAATFVNISDGKGFRVAVDEHCRTKTGGYAPLEFSKVKREIEAYKLMPASDLFMVEEVRVNLKPEDLPGGSGDKTVCDICGTMVRHKREIIRDGRALCPVCAGQAYFERLAPIHNINVIDPAGAAPCVKTPATPFPLDA